MRACCFSWATLKSWEENASEARQGGEKQGKRKEAPGESPGQTDPLLPESCSGAHSVGLMYWAD